MPVVVSDTSPIRALEFVGCLHVLPKLFDRILVPPAVATELTSTDGRYRKIDVLEHRFFQLASPYDQAHVDLLLQQLDRGEAEAIVLALEYKADALLIDESDGRAIARKLGLAVLGTLGILLSAKQRDLIEAVRPLVDLLREDLGFFIDDELRTEILRRAGEDG